jgi:hypothetical protein
MIFVSIFFIVFKEGKFIPIVFFIFETSHGVALRKVINWSMESWLKPTLHLPPFLMGFLRYEPSLHIWITSRKKDQESTELVWIGCIESTESRSTSLIHDLSIETF